MNPPSEDERNRLVMDHHRAVHKPMTKDEIDIAEYMDWTNALPKTGDMITPMQAIRAALIRERAFLGHRSSREFMRQLVAIFPPGEIYPIIEGNDSVHLPLAKLHALAKLLPR